MKIVAITVLAALLLIVGVVMFVTLNEAKDIGTAAATERRAASTATGQAALTAQSEKVPEGFLYFSDGTHIVGQDVSPGTYRTRIASPGCYHARLSGFGGTVEEIIANENTGAPSVVTIAPSDKGFVSRRCGVWSQDLSAITSNPTTFGDGVHIVGTDIQAGTYRSSGGQHCFYSRLSGFGGDLAEVIANATTDTPAVVTISPTDRGFKSSRCGIWNLLSVTEPSSNPAQTVAPRSSSTGAACLPYEPAAVKLNGTLVAHPGLRSWWAVKLETPICTIEGEAGSPESAYANVAELQLLMSEADFARYGPLLGRKVSVSGKLTPQITGYHQTRVMIGVTGMEATDHKSDLPVGQASQPPAKLLDVQRYFGSVTVVRNPDRVIKKAWVQDPSDLLQHSELYIDHMFNGPMDVMWVTCRRGYTTTGPTSSTGAHPFRMDPKDPTDPYWGILISDTQRSEITVGCQREATK